jgi:hypothetical protein
MTRRRWVADNTSIGLAIVGLGCAPPGLTLDDSEAESDGDSSGDGDPSGDGDTGPDDVPFAIESASIDATGQFVTLHFTEPVAPVDGVDPSAFRISHAAPTSLCGSDGCVAQTTYWDPNFYVNYYLNYGSPYQPPSDARFEVDLIGSGNAATEVILRFGEPLDPLLCEYLTKYAPEYVPMYVHHAPGDIPVRSDDGESLAAIGSQWVAQPLPVWNADGDFPNLVPMIPIPCGM